ncbi:STAS domain-containing protein [Bacillus sp. Marseille-Q1617]|uniref:STAS domain-containing protein n=1 Tax=Bacillus sp. Marseille-Q1617 TaxID=2736887 RepID=UPI00158E42FC|nr:STAS domain-containing protein [Bacillus sp. Marseille-Q1617]
MSSQSKLAYYLLHNYSTIAANLVEHAIKKMNIALPQKEKEHAVCVYETFFQFLGDSMLHEKQELPSQLIEWSKKNAEGQIVSGRNISEIIIRYPVTREIFASLTTQWAQEFSLTNIESIKVLQKMNALLDVSEVETVFAYEKLTKRMEEDYREELDSLANPVVPLKKGIAVLPLVGTIDSYRMDHLMDKVIPEISQLNLSYLIVDFSGVQTFDETTASYFQQIGSVLRLLGIRTILTGISPRLAQTAVNIGALLDDVTSFTNVKQALENIR